MCYLIALGAGQRIQARGTSVSAVADAWTGSPVGMNYGVSVFYCQALIPKSNRAKTLQEGTAFAEWCWLV